MTGPGPTVVVTDGDYDNSVHVATELARDLDATVVGVGTARNSRLLRSRYCDRGVVAPPPDADGHEAAIRRLVRDRRPDAVVPVGYHSTASLVAIRDDVPDGVALPIPEADAFATAVDKRRTMAAAADHGVDVPADHTGAVRAADEAGRPGDGIEAVDFPVFLKARRETGEADTAVVRERSAFWDAYDRLRRESDQPVLVQEYLDADDHTYACGALFVDGALEALVGHEEVRSVPRRGGSGTRVRLFRHPRVEAATVRLLHALEWNGVALVEFKRRRDGGYALMEVNPKFWASYALASQCGYRFASAAVAAACGLSADPIDPRPAQTGERVFPLRELAYWLRHREDESLTECLAAMLWPPARPDLNPTDPRAALAPPVSWGDGGDS